LTYYPNKDSIPDFKSSSTNGISTNYLINEAECQHYIRMTDCLAKFFRRLNLIYSHAIGYYTI